MDAARADGIVIFVEQARAALRRGDSEAKPQVESRYLEIREALDWNLDAGRADDAFRLAAALVPFWMAMSRAEEGIAWFDHALSRPGKPPPGGRGRSTTTAIWRSSPAGTRLPSGSSQPHGSWPRISASLTSRRSRSRAQHGSP